MKSGVRHSLFAAAMPVLLAASPLALAAEANKPASASAAASAIAATQPAAVVDVDALNRELDQQIREINLFRSRLPRIIGEFEKCAASVRNNLPRERDAD